MPNCGGCEPRSADHRISPLEQREIAILQRQQQVAEKKAKALE
jgi:hypothetical protein